MNTGDVLTSLVKVIIDMSYGMCYVFDFSWLNKTSHIVHDTQGCADSHVFTRYITPVLLALPLWLRFMQCLKRYNDTQKRVPNLPNAGKYAMAHTVVIVGAFHINFSDMDGFGLLHIAWLTCFIISTLYSFSWDVFMDWGLGDREHGGLRAKLMFHHPWKYYVAIAVDFVLRFSWTLTLVPATSQYPFSHYIQTRLVNVMAAIEISRRTMWSWLRLENEQLHNTAGYRRVDFVPLHFDSNVKDTRSKKQIDHRRCLWRCWCLQPWCFRWL